MQEKQKEQEVNQAQKVFSKLTQEAKATKS